MYRVFKHNFLSPCVKDMCISMEDADPVVGSKTFHFRDINESMFNLVRHALFKDVPVLAADTVTFIQYDGPLEPEMVSHRIGQLPLRCTDGASLVATFELNKFAEVAKSGLTWLTSTDIRCTSGNAEIVHYRSDRERRLASGDDGFLIVPLHPGQRLHLTFTARVSTGREATRWVSTACTPKFRPHYHITVETTGSITPAAAMKAALQDIIKKLNGLNTVVAGT